MAFMYEEDPWNRRPQMPQPAPPPPSPNQPQTSPAAAPPPPPAPKNFSDITAQSGGGMSEDFERFNDPGGVTFERWKPYLDPGCPKNKPYRSSRGAPGCYEKPTECPPGQGPQGPDETSPCGGKGYAKGGGGGGGKKGGQGGGTQGGQLAPGLGQTDMGAASDKIWEAIMSRLQAGPGGNEPASRFTPEIMATLQAQIKSQGEGAIRRGTEEANADLQRRGLARSSLAAGATRDVRIGIEGAMLQSNAQLARAKIDADFQDKTQAIQDSMNWLNSMRSYVASMTGTAAQKEAAMANIELGYQQLKHATNTMREQHAQQLQLLGFQI